MDPLALYIHIPFCQHKCIYCDFYSTTRTHLLPRYLAALQQEIAFYRRSPLFADRFLASLYWGGGTPSLIPPDVLEPLLETLTVAWPPGPDTEITLEANPGALDIRHLAGYRRAGINRLSLGIQSFDDRELQLLTRIHSAAAAHSAITAAREAGFSNLSLDLIFGLPGQSVTTYAASVTAALEYHPEHLSLYSLTVEPVTPLAGAFARGELQRCDEEHEREMFLTGKTLLECAGYRHYEISNYSRPGCEARHNQGYWGGSDYLGVGPAAHSYAAGKRWWNVRDLEAYLESWERGEPAVAGEETLGMEEKRTETVLLGLRRSAGIDLELWQQRFGEDLLKRGARVLKRLGGVALGSPPFAAAEGEALLTLNGARLALTRNGVLLYDLVCRELCAGIS
ncbi:MAG TPA: radical SAM family heme chaperone HemW [bacterium]|nr:radical SAM family heme chaperone HemW [bacterium]HQJ63491.1 radical SAM family heme chaperone HemW [bacterium]